MSKFIDWMNNRARNAALEEAAKVADDYRRDGTNPKEYAVETADELAARIRQLKTK